MHRKNIPNINITHIEGNHIGENITGFNNCNVTGNLDFSTHVIQSNSYKSGFEVNKKKAPDVREKVTYVGPIITGFQGATFSGNCIIDDSINITNNSKSSTTFIQSGLTKQVNRVETNNKDSEEKRSLEMLKSCLVRKDKDKPNHRERLKELKLTQSERQSLEMFKDPITEEYINVPVRLNEYNNDIKDLPRGSGVFYDLDTLLDSNNQKKYNFINADIKTNIPTEIKLRNIVNDIANNHKNDLEKGVEINNSVKPGF